MAFGEIIASAIGITLLIITAYVLVGGVLTTTQVAMNAQSEMTAVHMQMLGTAITIDPSEKGNSSLTVHMRNTGSEPIDLLHTNVFIRGQNSVPILIPKGKEPVAGTWSVDPVTKVQWRPTEVLNMTVMYEATTPVIFQITTGNGVSAITEIK